MKILNGPLSVFLLLLTFSCTNDELNPIITFDSALKGAYVRLIQETPRELDLQSPSSTQYDYTVEFVDFERGALVDQYDIYASFVDKNPDNGDQSASSILVKSYFSGDFIRSERGYLGMSVALTLEELSTSLNVAIVDIMALDQFKIKSRITTKDGKIFSASNSSATINGSAFQGHFRFTLKATCPLPDDLFVGEYKLDYTMDCGHFGCSIEESFVSIIPVEGESTQRQFDVRFLEIFGGWDVRIKIDIICDYVVLLTTDTGIGCGDNIMFRPGKPQPIDITDSNAVIFFEFIEDTGNCGAGTPLWLVKLTPVQ